MTRLATATGWIKAARSGNGGECVQAKRVPGAVLLSDSKYLADPSNDPELQPVIEVALQDWPALLQVVVGDVAFDKRLPEIERLPGGSVAIRSRGVELRFTKGEWTAFVGGVHDGEFDLAVQTAA